MRNQTRRQTQGTTLRRLAVGLVLATGGTGCGDASDEFRDDDAQDDAQDEDFRSGDEPIEVGEFGEFGEFGDLVIEASDLQLSVAKPLYPACPACGRIVARGPTHVDVELLLSGSYGYREIHLGLSRPTVAPAVVELPPTTGSFVGVVRLRSTVRIPSDAELLVFAWGE